MRQHNVYLDAFAIDRDEVSVADYRRCVAAGGCDLDPLISGDERYIHDDWPLVNVTWLEASDYCRWRGARLPTEAEWEHAARGDDVEATWPWGAVERPKDFNHGQPRAEAMREIERPQQTMLIPSPLLGDPDDSDGTVLIAPAGKYAWGEGPYGTRDQAGNVAEWTADAYIHEDNQLGYDNLAPTNPVREPKPGELTPVRVVRGGSWRQPAFVAHANLRDPFNRLYQQNLRFSHIGFLDRGVDRQRRVDLRIIALPRHADLRRGLRAGAARAVGIDLAAIPEPLLAASRQERREQRDREPVLHGTTSSSGWTSSHSTLVTS
ncbi:MAG: formylglycine-generating enzyme family protein [Deltaproteobacteria bacterium]|nr:MAG: formylglycine-generating enzyme family protein [Deltaproteobacteria bacterium]